MIRKLQFVLAFFAFSFVGNAQLYFENQATALGVDVAYGFGFLGGGVSFYDYNGDGLDDLTISSESGEDFYFFKNVGGTFVEDDLDISGGHLQTKQVIWVDYDNDGDNDFFAASDTGLTKLFRNDGGSSFTDVTATCGFPTEEFDTFGGSWGDYNNDGFLDVFISIRDGAQQTPNFLYENNGDGTFTNVTAAAGLYTTGFLSFCVAWFDYDNDGWQDIYIANDKYVTRNILYHNNGDGTFTDTATQAGADLLMGAMSTTIDDYNNDGWLDIYVSNDDQVVTDATVGNAFLKNNGDGTFTNIAVPTGTQFNSVAWSCVFLDADNDMDHDLYVSGSPTGDTELLSAAFYENDGNGIYTIPENIGFEGDTRKSYANAIGDVDNDGYPEIVVVNDRGDDIFLWKNESNFSNNYLKVGLEGTVSNRMGIGSWIEISAGGQVQYHYTLCGENYLGQNSGNEFFGLGDATMVDYVKVTWLSGQVDYLENIDVNQTLTIQEGSSPLSVDSFESTDVDIYPNPARNRVFIKLDQNIKVEEIRIYDVSGKEVEKFQLDSHNSFLVNHLSSGLYIVSIQTDAGLSIEKLVIN